MSKFFLRSKMNYLLNNNGKPPMVEVNFLGTGGAFDVVEKNSSAIIKTSAGSILVDCGSTVYSELRTRNLVDSIDCVFITHCHEDHIGSLSTLIYHKYFTQHQTVQIECLPALKPLLENYLKDICGHPEESFIINSNQSNLYESLNMIIYKIDTTNYHFKGLISSGFVFNFKKGGENGFIIYSGDLNIPITEVIKSTSQTLYDSLLKNPDNVFVFHESTTKSYPPNFPHCEYQKLEDIVAVFPNVYTYHHSKEDALDVAKTIHKKKLNLDAIKKAIDLDLARKVDLAKSYENKERLRVQARNIKEDFTEEFSMPQLKTKDLNIIGAELVIQEEMGL